MVFDLRSNHQKVVWLVHEYALSDNVRFYSRSGDKYRLQKAGDFSFHSDTDINYRLPQPLSSLLNPEKMLSISAVKSQGSMQLSFSLWSDEKLQIRKANELAFLGLIYGVIIAMTLYKLLSVLNFAIFSSFNLCMLFRFLSEIVFLHFQGLSSFVYPNDWYVMMSNQMLAVSANFTVILAALFGIVFFGLKFKNTYLYYLFLGIIFIGCCAITVSFVSYNNSIQLYKHINSLAVCVSLLVTCCISLMQRFRPAIYFFLGWNMFLSSLVIQVLALRGYFSLTQVSFFLPFLSAAIEMILFSWAIADHIRLNQEINHEKISALNRDLQKKEEARTVFFHNTSHELRTPIEWNHWICRPSLCWAFWLNIGIYEIISS